MTSFDRLCWIIAVLVLIWMGLMGMVMWMEIAR